MGKSKPTTRDGDAFVSEPIVPDAGTFDTAAMARGLPGLPVGFTWRDRRYRIQAVLEAWKASEREHHRSGDRYVRKHFWRLRLDDGSIATVYAVRQTKPGEAPKRRWWLWSLAQPAEP
jgi:phosphoribosylglycinamide formyltransferase-1